MAAAIALRTVSRRSACFSTLNTTFRAPLASSSTRIAAPISRRCFSSSRPAFVKKYTQDHEWIEMSDDGASATMGISTYAANALGDVVYVELPAVDLDFGVGDTIGAVESVKSASDILAPVSGTVVEVNNALEDKPALINKAPEGDAWLARIKVADEKELEGLMDGEAYKAFTEEAGSS